MLLDFWLKNFSRRKDRRIRDTNINHFKKFEPCSKRVYYQQWIEEFISRLFWNKRVNEILFLSDSGM